MEVNLQKNQNTLEAWFGIYAAFEWPQQKQLSTSGGTLLSKAGPKIEQTFQKFP